MRKFLLVTTSCDCFNGFYARVKLLLVTNNAVKHTQYIKDDGERLEPAELQKRIGEYIAESRHAKGYKLEKIAEDLNIRFYFLECIEQGKFNNLPGTVYTIGFIRSYAKYLDLNDQEIIEALMQTQKFIPEASYQPYAVENQKNFFSLWIIAISIIASATLLGYFISTAISKDDAVKKTIAAAETTTESIENKQQTTQYNLNRRSVASGQSLQKDHFYIKVKTPTWIKITDTNGAIISASMLSAERFFDITDYDNKKLTAGNAQALEFFLGTETISEVLPTNALNLKILEDFQIRITALQELAKKNTQSSKSEDTSPAINTSEKKSSIKESFSASEDED